MTDDAHLQVFRLIESNPKITQRDLARALGISLGKVNYCVKALIEKGWIKTNNFKNSKNKLAYVYILTPATGWSRKASLPPTSLKRKIQEFEALKLEIARLQEKVETQESTKILVNRMYVGLGAHLTDISVYHLTVSAL